VNESSPVHEKNGNTVPLKEYIERIIEERDKAVQVAYRSMEGRLDRLNELRSEVTEDRAKFLTRDRYDGEHGLLENRVASLENWRGKALGFGALLALIAAAVGALLESVVTRALGG